MCKYMLTKKYMLICIYRQVFAYNWQVFADAGKYLQIQASICLCSIIKKVLVKHYI